MPKGKTSTSISVRKPSEKIKTVKELTFPCTLCERRFQYERGLKRHVLQKHERSHHQLREENFSHQINPSDKSETDLNDSSSDLGDLPSSPLPSPSRPESGRYTETDTETEAETDKETDTETDTMTDTETDKKTDTEADTETYTETDTENDT